jgi:hypothetical protein
LLKYKKAADLLFRLQELNLAWGFWSVNHACVICF